MDAIWNISDLTPAEQKEYALALSRFFSNLEALSTDSLNAILLPLFNELSKNTGRDSTEYWKEFQKRRLNLRRDFNNFFSEYFLLQASEAYKIRSNFLEILETNQSSAIPKNISVGCSIFLSDVQSGLKVIQK